VKIDIAEPVAVTPAQAIAAYGDPSFYDGRATRDDIAVLGVANHEVLADRVLIEVHFQFQGTVSSAVRRVIDHTKMSWITRTELFPEELRSTWTVLPDHYPDRLTASGQYRFEEGADGPESAVVRVHGDLRVHVPLVGGTVERVIVSGLRSYIRDEVTSIPDMGTA
jgi:hypothetical protein